MRNTRFLAVLALALLPFAAFSQPDWNTSPATIEDRLKNEPIASSINFRTYLRKKGITTHITHAIRLITLESGLKAIFKKGNYRYAEVAAYRASKTMGLDLVPPTVFKEIDGVQGSLQLYIDAPDLVTANQREQLKKVGPKAVSDMKIFYYVVGQWDTHAGNQIVARDSNGYALYLIDNSAILHRSYSVYGRDTFIEKGENPELPSDQSSQFPFDKAVTVSGNLHKKLPLLFGPYLSAPHAKSLAKNSEITYVAWKDTLWLRREPKMSLRVSKYYSSTLSALESLTKNDLEKIWAEWLLIEPVHGKELIRLALERRDEVLRVAYSSGKIKVG